MQIRIAVKSGIWRNAGEERIVRRIASAVYGHDAEVAKQDDGYKWTLNRNANDWWATAMEETTIDDRKAGVITVHYRYGGGGNADMMKALETFLNWVFA